MLKPCEYKSRINSHSSIFSIIYNPRTFLKFNQLKNEGIHRRHKITILSPKERILVFEDNGNKNPATIMSRKECLLECLKHYREELMTSYVVHFDETGRKIKEKDTGFM